MRAPFVLTESKRIDRILRPGPSDGAGAVAARAYRQRSWGHDHASPAVRPRDATTGRPGRPAHAAAGRATALRAAGPRAGRLAIRARTSGLSAADVDRELTERRSLLITWLNRGTLHLVRSEDYPLLQLLTTPPLQTAITRRLAQEGGTH